MCKRDLFYVQKRPIFCVKETYIISKRDHGKESEHLWALRPVCPHTTCPFTTLKSHTP